MQYTIHIEFDAPDNAKALERASWIVRAANVAIREINPRTWDISSVDCTGAQDWSVIVPRLPQPQVFHVPSQG